MTGRKLEANPLARYVGVIERKPKEAAAEPEAEGDIKALIEELQTQLEGERSRASQLEQELRDKAEALSRSPGGDDERKALEGRIAELEESLNRIKDDYAKKMKNTIALTKIKYEKEIDKLRKDLKKYALNAGVDENEVRAQKQALETQEENLSRRAADMAAKEKELDELRDLKRRVASGEAGAGTAGGPDAEALRKEKEAMEARVRNAESELLNLKKGSVAMLKYATQMQAKKQEDELKKLRESYESEFQTRVKVEDEIRKKEEDLEAREKLVRERLENASVGATADTKLLKSLEAEVQTKADALKAREEKLKAKEREIIDKIKGLEAEIRQKIKDGKIIQDIKREFAQKEEEIKAFATALRAKEHELSEREGALKKGGAVDSTQAASGPASAELQAQFAQKDMEVTALRERVGTLTADVNRLNESLGRASQSSGAAVGAMQDEIRRLRHELETKSDELRTLVEPMKYKEQEHHRRELELSTREQVLQEQLKKAEYAVSSGVTTQQKAMQTRLEELEATVRQKDEELRVKENFVRSKEDELRRREEKVVAGEVLAMAEELQAEFKIARAKTGNPRMDDLLFGGVPFGMQCLLMGPPFIGKETMADVFLSEGMRKGIPAVYITTDAAAVDIREELKNVIPNVEEYEKMGLMRYIDVFSKSMGLEESDPAVRFIEHPTDYKGIMGAIQEYEREFKEKNWATYRLQVRSISTLVTYSDPTSTYRFLQGLTGRAKRSKVVGFYLLDKGMHSDQEIQTIGHVMDGAFEFKTDGVKTFFIVQGVGDVQSRTWIQYQYSKKGLNVGSFTLDRIT